MQPTNSLSVSKAISFIQIYYTTKSCARHELRDKKMKKTIMTVAMLAFLMGGVCTTVSAMETNNTTRSEIVAGDDWDKILNEYEKYVDQYIKTYKKAMNGDMTAMSEYVKLAEKAQKLADKLEKAEDEMTTAQLKRYAKITEKMQKALLDN